MYNIGTNIAGYNMKTKFNHVNDNIFLTIMSGTNVVKRNPFTVSKTYFVIIFDFH